ncbi:MAG TPA: FCD domain-containing protein [Pseudonocardia sp.]|jgi:DNA-binding FadR family transcriptional regulator
MFQRSEKVPHTVARAIVSDVMQSHLPPGSTLQSEGEMMARYQVSRGSLREALRILEVLGFITMKPGPKGGPMLLEADSSQLASIATLYYQRLNATYEEILQLRLTLERDAALNAARCRSPEQIDELNRYIEMSRSMDLTNDREFSQVGQGFHDLVARVAGNRVSTLVIRSCFDVFKGKTNDYLYPVSERPKVAKVHEQIAMSIIDGQPAVAQAMMNDHLQDYLTQALARYSIFLHENVTW